MRSKLLSLSTVAMLLVVFGACKKELHTNVPADRLSLVESSTALRKNLTFVNQPVVKVLSPNAFQPKELRNYQRLDERKERLKFDIKQSLATSKNYGEFEQKMRTLKYEVIKMRGIAFRDQQEVYTKGSEVGYSLAHIEKILSQKQQLRIAPKTEILQCETSHKNYFEKQTASEKMIPGQTNKQTILEILLKTDSAYIEGTNHSLL